MQRIWFRLLALLCLSSLATSAAAEEYGFANTSAIVNKTDLSINLLSQIFGTVGSVLQGSSGQMFGHLLYQLNNALIIVVGLWLAFSITMMIVRSASEGSFMGQNKNIGAAFLKVCAGVTLLLPNPSTGYSLMQEAVAEVVVQSVGFADATWNYALNYLTNGGQVFRPTAANPGSPSVSDDQVSAALSPKTGDNALLSAIFSAEVCQLSGQYAASNSSTSVVSTSYPVLTDDDRFLFVFPGYGNQSTDPTQYNGPQDSDPKKQTATCGTISWNVQSACTNVAGADLNGATDADDNKSVAQCSMARDAISNAIQVLQPAAHEYYCSRHPDNTAACSGVSGSSVQTDMVNALSMSVIDYYNLIQPLALSQQTTSPVSNFSDNAKSAGWLTAGRYYWDLAAMGSSGAPKLNLQNYVPAAADMATYNPADDFSGDAAAALTDAKTTYYGGNHSVCSNMPNGSVTCLIDQYNTTASATAHHNQDLNNSPVNFHCGFGDFSQNMPNNNKELSALKNTAKFFVDVGKTFCQPFQDMTESLRDSTGYGVVAGVNNVFANPEANPIVFLSKLGSVCLNLGINIWVMPLVLIITVGTLASICSGGKYVSVVLRWVQGFFSTVAIALCASGLMLTLYMPLYPYMLFTFGVLHWFISVIEAMVAAPLICFGLTHPEGHDLLGKAQQALMFFLSLFLRPVLMVVGIFCGIIVSYVGMELLVYTFTGLMTDLLATTPSDSVTGNGQVWQSASHFMNNVNVHGALQKFFVQFFVITPGILAAFCMLVYAVLTKSFGLIHELPDSIMAWIGVRNPSSNVEQMAGQLKGALTQTGKTAAKSTSQASGLGAAMGTGANTKIHDAYNGSGGGGSGQGGGQ